MAEQRTIRKYGWKPSLHDARDLVADPSGIKILPEVDPRKNMPAPWNQGQLGSCTAHGAKIAMVYDQIINDGSVLHDYSREAIYWFERFIEGAPLGEDTGAMGRDAFKAAVEYGLPTEALWPYEDTTSFKNYAVDPRKDLPAGDFVKLERPYKAVPQTDESFKSVLSNNQVISFGFTVYQSFEGDWDKTGLMPMPQRGEGVLGGHEIAVVGYLKDEPDYYLCRNSWDVTWGLGGYFLMPKKFILSKDASDFITVYRAA